MSPSIVQLEKALQLAPVMGQFHPLVPLCLPPQVRIMADSWNVLEELDALELHPEYPLMLTKFEAKFSHRFLGYDHLTCPSAKVINLALPHRFNEARQWLLTHHKIADRIVTDIKANHYQTVILLLVDGLSYADVQDWSEAIEPCLIDGPSITFSRTTAGEIDSQVGFPAIIGTPPLARRLANFGLKRARGYSYWERAQNEVSATLFEGMSLDKVSSIQEAMEQMFDLDLKGMYIQLVREGLDGLAHSRREVRSPEIKAAVAEIHRDVQLLIEMLVQKNLLGVVYLMADHGILWKEQHEWKELKDGNRQHTRYGIDRENLEQTTTIRTDKQLFYLCHYPYLDRQPRANDSGIHGGLSYQESIVPFVRAENIP